MSAQAAQRGKAAAPTQAEEGDPLGSQYGDVQLIQSRAQAAEAYLSIESLSEEQNGQKVQSAQSLNISIRYLCATADWQPTSCWSWICGVML